MFWSTLSLPTRRTMLRDFTTFKIGGPAKEFITVRTIEELRKALDTAERIFILGGGSNVLFSDEGFDGTVIKIGLQGIEKEENTLVASAGELWDTLVERAVCENLWGLENLSGIPGTVGGAIAGSIGAYGQALSQTCEWVDVLDRTTEETKRMTNAECKFGYRESLFSRGGFVILKAAFKLTHAGTPEASYIPELSKLGLSEIRKKILEIRAGKFPDLSVEGTAGSFFKNPIMAREEAAKLKARYPEMPTFDMPETNGIKIPLAWLLDHVLNLKGMRVGRARLFEKQPLVIAAENNCTAAEVIALFESVKKKVKENFKIEIIEEVKVIHK